MKRLARALGVAGLVVLAALAVLGLLVLLLGFLLPDALTNLRVGTDAFRVQITQQTENFVQAVRINPLVDLLLIAGAYVFVSLVNWLQDQVVFYLTNRRHFQ